MTTVPSATPWSTPVRRWSVPVALGVAILLFYLLANLLPSLIAFAVALILAVWTRRGWRWYLPVGLAFTLVLFFSFAAFATSSFKHG